MRLRGAILLGMIIAITIAGAASAQTQAVTASVDANVEERPESLPGVYDVNTTVTVNVAGGQCLCEETRIQLVGDGEQTGTIQFEPESYAIDWTQQTADGSGGEHVQQVDATVAVPDVEEGPLEATIDVEMEHEPGAHMRSNSNPATVELLLPDNPSAAELENASAEEEEASEDDGDANGVPGPAAGLSAIAAIGAAVVRRRG